MYLQDGNDYDDATYTKIQNKLREAVESQELDQEPGESDDDYTDRINEEMDDTINLWEIDKDSVLYHALNKWFTIHGAEMSKAIRGFVDEGNSILFITGAGYDFISSDLLGGSADGSKQREFLDWINE